MPRAHYAAETFIKNHPDGLLKAIVGKLSRYLAENGHDIRQMTINCVLSDEGKEARSWYVDETYFNVKGK